MKKNIIDQSLMVMNGPDGYFSRIEVRGPDGYGQGMLAECYGPDREELARLFASAPEMVRLLAQAADMLRAAADIHGSTLMHQEALRIDALLNQVKGA